MGGFRLDVSFTPPKIDASRMPAAIARGLNEGADKVRTVVQRELKRQTNVKAYRSITSRVRTVRAGPGRLVYEIRVKDGPIPLKEFPVTVTDKGVDAKTWGVDHLFKRSFVLHGGFAARSSSARFPIHALLGPNLGKEVSRGAIPALFAEASAQFVPPAIIKHMVKALG